MSDTEHGPDETTPAIDAPQQPTEPTAQTAQPTPAPQPWPGATYGPYGPPTPTPGYAVVKEAWINPRRKTQVVLSTIAAAVVLFAAGGITGAAISHHRDHNMSRHFERDGSDRMGPGGNPGYPFPRRNNPGGPMMPTPSSTTTS